MPLLFCAAISEKTFSWCSVLYRNLLQVIVGALLTDVGYMESHNELKRGSQRSSRGLSEGRLAMWAHGSVGGTEKSHYLGQNSLSVVSNSNSELV